MEEFDKIAIKKDEDKKEKILDWLWGTDEKRTVLGLLKGRKRKKQEKEVP
jgi:hypothetical protein